MAGKICHQRTWIYRHKGSCELDNRSACIYLINNCWRGVCSPMGCTCSFIKLYPNGWIHYSCSSCGFIGTHPAIFHRLCYCTGGLYLDKCFNRKCHRTTLDWQRLKSFAIFSFSSAAFSARAALSAFSVADCAANLAASAADSEAFLSISA